MSGFGTGRLVLRAVFLWFVRVRALEQARRRCHDDGSSFVVESLSR